MQKTEKWQSHVCTQHRWVVENGNTQNKSYHKWAVGKSKRKKPANQKYPLNQKHSSHKKKQFKIQVQTGKAGISPVDNSKQKSSLPWHPLLFNSSALLTISRKQDSWVLIKAWKPIHIKIGKEEMWRLAWKLSYFFSIKSPPFKFLSLKNIQEFLLERLSFSVWQFFLYQIILLCIFGKSLK